LGKDNKKTLFGPTNLDKKSRTLLLAPKKFPAGRLVKGGLPKISGPKKNIRGVEKGVKG